MQTKKNKESIRQAANIRFLLQHPTALLAFGFGSGLSPKMPGTIGTIAAMPFLVVFALMPWWCFASLVALSAIAGIWICGWTAKALDVHDHPGIVWDEFAGYWVALLFCPIQWKTACVAFVLFRFFDILKPWPISIADKKLGGGLGIMLDDILAGLVSGGLIWCLLQAGWL